MNKISTSSIFMASGGLVARKQIIERIILEMGHGVQPLAGDIHSETLLPPRSSLIADSFLPSTATMAMQSDSDLTCNNLLLPARKRSRDSAINPSISYHLSSHLDNSSCFSFLDEDVLFQIQQQQFEIDLMVYHQMEKVRMEVEEKRKRHVRRVIGAIEAGMRKRLRAQEEEVDKIGKLNCALEERVRYLVLENQILRELAQTNEATANALRTDLEHILARAESQDQERRRPIDAVTDDAQSCCASNDSGGETAMKEERRWCRKCWKEKASVLVLPCRHLCLCTVCGSSIHCCPVCKSTNNASVHVIFS